MLEQDLVRHAQEFAKSDAVAEVLKRLEEKFTADWKATGSGDQDEREHCFRMVLAIDALREELKIVAQSTKITEWNRRLARTTTVR